MFLRKFLLTDLRGLFTSFFVLREFFTKNLPKKLLRRFYENFTRNLPKKFLREIYENFTKIFYEEFTKKKTTPKPKHELIFR